MSRKLLAFLLNELNTVRVKCEQCGKIVELSVSELADIFKFGHCPICRHIITNVTGPDSPFVQLSSAITTLKALKKTVGIEFVLPDESDSKSPATK